MSAKQGLPTPTNRLFESFRCSFIISFRTYVGSGLHWSYHFTSFIRPSRLEILRRNTCSIIKAVSSPLVRRLRQTFTRDILPAIICSHLQEFSLLGYHLRASVAYGEPELPMTRGPLSISLDRQSMNWSNVRLSVGRVNLYQELTMFIASKSEANHEIFQTSNIPRRSIEEGHVAQLSCQKIM